VATFAYNAATGSRKWLAVYHGRRPSEQTQSVAASPDGALVYVTGTTPGFRSNSLNATTIAYRTATGMTSWAARYRGRRDFSGAASLAVGPTGQAVFITGFLGAHDGCCNFLTVAYQP